MVSIAAWKEVVVSVSSPKKQVIGQEEMDFNGKTQPSAVQFEGILGLMPKQAPQETFWTIILEGI